MKCAAVRTGLQENSSRLRVVLVGWSNHVNVTKWSSVLACWYLQLSHSMWKIKPQKHPLPIPLKQLCEWGFPGVFLGSCSTPWNFFEEAKAINSNKLLLCVNLIALRGPKVFIFKRNTLVKLHSHNRQLAKCFSKESLKVTFGVSDISHEMTQPEKVL